MTDLKDEVLKDFDVIHEYSQFDRRCLDGSSVSDLFVDLFLGGPEILFESIKGRLPLTYKSLISCNDLWLMEEKQNGQEASMFTLGVIYDDYVISSQMLNKGLIKRRSKTGNILPKSMNVLNVEFHCFYHCFNGLSDSRGRGMYGIKNYNLPGALNYWDEVGNHCKEYNIKLSSSLKKEISSIENDLLVWIDNGEDEVFLIEDNPSSEDVYRVNFSTSDFSKLENPVQEMDKYFREVILRSAS